MRSPAAAGLDAWGSAAHDWRVYSERIVGASPRVCWHDQSNGRKRPTEGADGRGRRRRPTEEADGEADGGGRRRRPTEEADGEADGGGRRRRPTEEADGTNGTGKPMRESRWLKKWGQLGAGGQETCGMARRGGQETKDNSTDWEWGHECQVPS